MIYKGSGMTLSKLISYLVDIHTAGINPPVYINGQDTDKLNHVVFWKNSHNSYGDYIGTYPDKLELFCTECGKSELIK